MRRSFARGPNGVRIVADTQTAVSAFLWGGLPCELPL